MFIIEKKRLTTVKTRIKPITSGSFTKAEGMSPSYVLAGNGLRLSRVRVLATVVDKFAPEGGKFAALTLDDGTDTIRLKVFNALSMLEGIEVSDIIDVIGRVKEYNGELYLAPEIITKSEPNFELLRELEIRQQDRQIHKIRELVLQHKNEIADFAELARLLRERYGIDEELVEGVLATRDAPAAEESVNVKEKVLQLIEQMDTGNGCDYNELMEASKLSEEIMDSVINGLLEEGTCFEPKPGKIKKL